MIWFILLGLFLIVHALIHFAFIAPVPPAKPGAPAWPFSMTHSWIGLSESALKGIGTTLVVISVVGFLMLALAVFGWLVPVAWVKPLALVAGVASLALMIIFWSNNFVVGAFLDVAIIVYFLFYFHK